LLRGPVSLPGATLTTRARLRASLSTSGENGAFGAVVVSAVAGYGLVVGGSVAGIATTSRWGDEPGEGTSPAMQTDAETAAII